MLHTIVLFKFLLLSPAPHAPAGGGGGIRGATGGNGTAATGLSAPAMKSLKTYNVGSMQMGFRGSRQGVP